MNRVMLVALLFAGSLLMPILPAHAVCSSDCDKTEIECSEKCCNPLPVASCDPESACRKDCASKWNNCVFRCDEPPKLPK
jgi:hypothetical protein